MNDRVKITITTDFIKLDSFLKLVGAYSTGGEAKEAVQGGSAVVNGETCLMRGKKLRNGDVVTCQGQTYEVVQNDG